MSKLLKYISSIFMALSMGLCSMGVAHAEVADPGKIVVSSKVDTPITYTMYKVGTFDEDSGKYVVEDNIKKQGVSDFNVDSSFDADETAAQLAKLDFTGMSSEKADAGSAGSISFDNLDSGAYLIIAKPSDSKYTAKPILALLRAPDEYDIEAKITETPTTVEHQKEKKEAPRLFANDQTYLYAMIAVLCLGVAIGSMIVGKKKKAN